MHQPQITIRDGHGDRRRRHHIEKELFGGGTGGGVTITPLAFLIVKNGDVKLLQVQSYNNTADRVVGMVPDVMDKVSGLISGAKKEKDAAEG